jgi:hypothetical protein
MRCNLNALEKHSRIAAQAGRIKDSKDSTHATAS